MQALIVSTRRWSANEIMGLASIFETTLFNWLRDGSAQSYHRDRPGHLAFNNRLQRAALARRR